MQILIDIPDGTYEEICNARFPIQDGYRLVSWIKNGTILSNHGRKFEGIVVEYPPAELCIYPEYKGRPYFSIRYEENGEHIIGFGTYNPEVLTRYLQEYFISDIQPKTGHWINCGSFVTCSECGEEQYGIDTGRFYCQNCGAKMVDPQERSES